MIKTSFKLESSASTQLPPLDKSQTKESNTPSLSHRKVNRNDSDNVIAEYQLKFEQIKKEN